FFLGCECFILLPPCAGYGYVSNRVLFILVWIKPQPKRGVVIRLSIICKKVVKGKEGDEKGEYLTSNIERPPSNDRMKAC
ncbi:hypothetical protein, partial [Salmonella enterica]|uniref:hypothetical protein n=1 Tax=Salmonella enterica TaxID=28901 RepID=UPI003297AE6A